VKGDYDAVWIILAIAVMFTAFGITLAAAYVMS